MGTNFCLSLRGKRILKIYISAFLLSLTMSSCTTQITPKTSIQKIPGNQPELREIENWTWKGKFIFKKKNEAKLGSLTWRKRGLSNYISVKGPLGINIDNFLIREGEILNQKTGELRNSQQLSILSDELFLYDLPLDSIHVWLLGLAPRKYSNPLIQNQHQDLQITYLDWKNFNGYFLPSKIFLQSKLAQIKLVTLNWQEKND